MQAPPLDARRGKDEWALSQHGLEAEGAAYVFVRLLRGDRVSGDSIRFDENERIVVYDASHEPIVIFGPSFDYEPTEADHEEAAFPWR